MLYDPLATSKLRISCMKLFLILVTGCMSARQGVRLEKLYYYTYIYFNVRIYAYNQTATSSTTQLLCTCNHDSLVKITTT